MQEQSSIEQSSTEQSLTGDSLKIVETMQNDKNFQSFLADSLRQKDAVLRDTAFQDFVTTLEAQQPLQRSQHKNQPGEPSGLGAQGHALSLRFFLTG